MIPHDAMVAITGSLSNHCDTKSTALMVISWTNATRWSDGRARNERPRGTMAIHSRGSSRTGSGGRIPITGLMNRTISDMRWPNSGYASASRFENRRMLRTVRPRSFVIHR